jgi:hypothetical protein
MVSGLERGRSAPVNPADTVIGYIKRFPALNTDVSVTSDGMPPEVSGKAAFRVLHDRGFANLSRVLQRVHAGEPFRFSRQRTRDEYRGALAVVNDLAENLRVNEERLLDQAVVKGREYKGSATTIYELVLTFYEVLSDGIVGDLHRARTLSEQEGFVLSPKMREVLEAAENK